LALRDRIYAVVLRTTLWPLMNVATGRSIHRKMQFLDRSQWWPRERLEAYQLAKLQRLIRHVYDRVPFYGREMRRRKLRPEDFTSLDVLREMPVVTKTMLQENPGDFLAAGYRFEDLITGSTSGSTGQPTRFYRTREQDSWYWALKYRMWGMAGYRLGEPYVHLYNSPRPGRRKRVQDLLLRNTPVYLFEADDQPGLLASVLAILSRRHIRFLAGCTTPIRVLADHRASLPSSPPIYLRAILTTGNVLTDHEREVLQRVLGAPVWDHYGLGGEGMHVAAECEEHDGYHINMENVLIEPENSLAAETGESTNLYVTALDNYGWPLIRYDTQDAAVFNRRSCPCGRGLPLLERIDGRLSDVIVLPNGRRITAHFFAIIGKSFAVAQYQVEQRTRDSFLIRVRWKGNHPIEEEKNRIVECLRRAGGEAVRVSFEDVSRLPPSPGGKHRYIIPLEGPNPVV